MPVEVNEASVLPHLKTDRVPLKTLLAALDARGGKRLTHLFRTLQGLVERKRITLDVRPLHVFECLTCHRAFASERACEQHRSAKHPRPEQVAQNLASLGIDMNLAYEREKQRKLDRARMSSSKYAVVTERPVLERCPQCGLATLKRITVPWRDGATKIRSWCTNPECGYKDEDTC